MIFVYIRSTTQDTHNTPQKPRHRARLIPSTHPFPSTGGRLCGRVRDADGAAGRVLHRATLGGDAQAALRACFLSSCCVIHMHGDTRLRGSVSVDTSTNNRHHTPFFKITINKGRLPDRRRPDGALPVRCFHFIFYPDVHAYTHMYIYICVGYRPPTHAYTQTHTRTLTHPSAHTPHSHPCIYTCPLTHYPSTNTQHSDQIVAFFKGEDEDDAPVDEEAELWRRRLSLMSIGLGSGYAR